jgi:predicted permease
MQLAVILLKRIFIMFLLMAVGYMLFKTHIITLEGNKELGTFLLYVILPCVIINSYITEYSEIKLIGLLISFAAALISLLISILVSRFLFGNKYKIEHFGSAFSNAAFIGIPLVQASVGDEAVFYIAAFVTLLNILQWVYGVMVLSGSRETASSRMLAKNPIILAMIISIVLFRSRIPVPAVIHETLQLIGKMNSPVAMIVLGIYLAQMEFRNLFKGKHAFICSFGRLILIPLITFAVLSIIPIAYRDIKLTMLIAASAPVGANIAIFAQLYG